MLHNAEIQLSTNFLDKYCKGYTQKEAEKIITHDHIVLYGFALGWWCKEMCDPSRFDEAEYICA